MLNVLWLVPVVGFLAADSTGMKALWVLGGAAGYAAVCAIWPFTNCRSCGGSGRRRSPSGRNYGRCFRCRGNPERVRFGRRLFAARPR